MNNPVHGPRLLATWLAGLALLTGGLLAPLTLPAAERTYRVDLILFRNLDSGTVGGEVWQERTLVPDTTGAIDLDDISLPAGFTNLSPAAGDLSREATLLDRSPRYQVLRHLVWQQPGRDRDTAIPIRVRGGRGFDTGDPDDALSVANTSELDGTVRVILRRYLHLETDLVYRRPAGGTATGELPGSGGLISAPIRQKRRMRSGELHYLDHPFLGILVKITPVESP